MTLSQYPPATRRSLRRMVRDRQVWIRPRGCRLPDVKKGWPLNALMTSEEAVAEARLWPKQEWAVRIRIVPNAEVREPRHE